MTTITETFHDAANAPSNNGYVSVRAYDFRTAADNHTITPEPRNYPLGPVGEFSAVLEPGPTVFEIVLPHMPVRTRIVDVPATGTHVLHDLAVLSNPDIANFSPSILAVLSGLTWEAFA